MYRLNADRIAAGVAGGRHRRVPGLARTEGQHRPALRRPVGPGLAAHPADQPVQLHDRRRSEAEVRQLARSGLECLRVEVSDRFGDYGLVGVAIFGAIGDALAIDTMLLSCRVLGRGVEHAMLAHLGRLAVDRGLGLRRGPVRPLGQERAGRAVPRGRRATARPARRTGRTLYRIPAAEAAGLAYRPGEDARDQLEFARTGGKKKAAPGPARRGATGRPPTPGSPPSFAGPMPCSGPWRPPR